MAYMNLMYRERADIQCDDPAARAADLKTADEWVDKTMATKKAKAEKQPGAGGHRHGSEQVSTCSRGDGQPRPSRARGLLLVRRAPPGDSKLNHRSQAICGMHIPAPTGKISAAATARARPFRNVQEDSDRQPGRDRGARHTRLPRNGHRHASPSIPTSTAPHFMSASPTRLTPSARRRRPSLIFGWTRSST